MYSENIKLVFMSNNYYVQVRECVLKTFTTPKIIMTVSCIHVYSTTYTKKTHFRVPVFHYWL